MTRTNHQAYTKSGIEIETWLDATYIDPSDLSAVDAFEVIVPVCRPYLLKVDGNQQAFSTEGQRQAYLDWRIKLADKRSAS
jgi:hypothetical protein